MKIRTAAEDERGDARTIFDAAMLEVDQDALDSGTVLIAVEEQRLLGALLLDGARVDAVAVRPGRRGQGIGAALIETAADRRGTLTATFDRRVKPFYESLEFDVEPLDADGRFSGVGPQPTRDSRSRSETR
jgi:GNAT superfamily N-acetyltransferase